MTVQGFNKAINTQLTQMRSEIAARDIDVEQEVSPDRLFPKDQNVKGDEIRSFARQSDWYQGNNNDRVSVREVVGNAEAEIRRIEARESNHPLRLDPSDPSRQRVDAEVQATIDLALALAGEIDAAANRSALADAMTAGFSTILKTAKEMPTALFGGAWR